MNTNFEKAEDEFINWLEIFAYSKQTISIRKRSIKDFFTFLETVNINEIKQITNKILQNFVTYQSQRENKVYGSCLSNGSINVSISTVNKFFEFLYKTGKINLQVNKLDYLEEIYKPKTILTPQEIGILYETTYILKTKHEKSIAVAQRDRAMLGIYYGCGLRRSEGTELKINDILTQRKLLHVRKGKGNKERYVPITENNLKNITEYLDFGRKYLLTKCITNNENESFFINQYSQSCLEQGLSCRLDYMVKLSENAILQSKKPSLHTLRHSIATHLLQNGMEIELIQKFLGHATLETTQIYTHIINEL